MKNVYDNIKKFRELREITRETMAANLKMSLSNYSKIERGQTDITISRLSAISQIFKVDLSQLLNFDASQIFNITQNQLVQGAGAKAETINFHGDDYKEKYIKMLETENERLKNAASIK